MLETEDFLPWQIAFLRILELKYLTFWVIYLLRNLSEL